jgi:hypothetical protein
MLVAAPATTIPLLRFCRNLVVFLVEEVGKASPGFRGGHKFLLLKVPCAGTLPAVAPEVERRLTARQFRPRFLLLRREASSRLP